MQPDVTPFHVDLPFMAPLSEERAAKLINFVSANLIGTVIDLGCGWAEVLIRILQVTPNAKGVGIDLEESSITHALALARERGIDDRITLIAGDARDHLPASSDAAVCIGASQIWGPPVEVRPPSQLTDSSTSPKGDHTRTQRHRHHTTDVHRHHKSKNHPTHRQTGKILFTRSTRTTEQAQPGHRPLRAHTHHPHKHDSRTSLVNPSKRISDPAAVIAQVTMVPDPHFRGCTDTAAEMARPDLQSPITRERQSRRPDFNMEEAQSPSDAERTDL